LRKGATPERRRRRKAWAAVAEDGTHDAEITRFMPSRRSLASAIGSAGLIHVSEPAPRRVAEPADAVPVGDNVR
jgi:ribosomal protein S1